MKRRLFHIIDFSDWILHVYLHSPTLRARAQIFHETITIPYDVVLP